MICAGWKLRWFLSIIIKLAINLALIQKQRILKNAVVYFICPVFCEFQKKTVLIKYSLCQPIIYVKTRTWKAFSKVLESVPFHFWNSNNESDLKVWATCALRICSPLRQGSQIKMAANILSVVGGVFLAYRGVNFLLQVIQGIKTFVLPSLGFRKDLKAFGSWAG